MAFYQKTPQQERMEKRKRRFADWSEEGTRYQKKPSRQTSSSGKDHRRSNEEGASPRGYSRDQKFHRDSAAVLPGRNPLAARISHGGRRVSRKRVRVP